uniref:Domain of unknown function DB domain-containing protein n=1 Tax=Parascaris univalens TaxID=6257 RepID=A0A915C9A6_PARUN
TTVILPLFVCVLFALPLDKVATDCCGSASRCCLSRLASDSPLEGCDTELDWRNMTACVEKLLWNETFANYKLDECCAYLYPARCSTSCTHYMRSPTRNDLSRLSFTIDCPPKKRIPLEDDCVASIKRKLHSCFGICVARKAAGLDYQPHQHCPSVIDPETLDPCIGDEI